MSNRTYSVLFCTNTTYVGWSRLTNIEPAASTNRTIFVTNVLNAEAIRTYRLTTPKLP
jgi:hypothetical protein